MDDGEVLARHCVPTESIVEFSALPIQASVIEGHGTRDTAVRLPSKHPPQLTWQTFHFVSSDFYVRDLANGITTDRLPVSVLRDDASDSVVEPYHATRPGPWLFTIYVELPDPPTERFEFLLPAIVIDGQEILVSTDSV